MGEDRSGDTEKDSGHLVFSMGGSEVLMLITFLGHPCYMSWAQQ